MGRFTKKTWKDRVTEYPTRRTLTKADNSTELVSVSRSEGAVSEEGDAFSASNMNDQESRFNAAIDGIDADLTANSKSFHLDYQNNRWGWNETAARGADTFHPFRGAYTLTQIPTCIRPSYATIYPLEAINNGIILDVKDYSSLRITAMGGTAWAIQGITSGGNTATLANGVNAYYTPATYDITNYDTIKIVSYSTDGSATDAQVMSGILS